MAKDPTEFRNRFNLYKLGKMPYENGLPKYDDGRKPLSYWDNKQSTAYDIPFIPEKQIKLTDAGLATGAVLSTNLLDSIADNAYAAGLPIETALGLAVKESTLGNPTDDSSVRHILNSARYATFKELGTGLHIYKGDRALNGQEIINYHKGDNDFGTRYINTGDYKRTIESKNQSILKTGFEFYKENPDRYNPGQKNYSELVNKRGKEVVNSPEVKKWRKEWNDSKIKIMRPEPYKINTTIQSTAAPKFGSWKNGKMPEYGGGKIGHNISHAEMNNDGTFTDDYTKLFEDMYVTPQKTDLKRGSYTLNNFPYYLQHRTDWMKPFMSSGTNEKGLELVYPEFDVLSGARVLQQMSKPFAKILQTPDILRKYNNVWDKHYFKALLENDIKGAQNLREAHFRINAPNTKVTKPQYHTVDDLYDPKYNSFDKDIENLDASFYTSDNPYVSGTYSKELVSEAERDYIIETTRQQLLKRMLSYRNELHLTNPHYWELVDPNKFRLYALKTFKWLDTPVNPDRLKKVYLNIKNPFEIDAKGKYWSQFEFEDFPKAMLEVMLPRGYSMYRPWSTRSIEDAYPKLGYDSAIIQNLIDIGGNKRYFSKGIPSTIIETKNPNNIKYVDAVTYDDSGNIIPLSERDNFNLNDFRYADGKLPGYKNGKIHIKPANRGKFTALKKRTGHSASWFKENGTPAQKKMAIFALNAKKWKH